MSDASPRFRRFVLYRVRDVSGVSGTGVVAYGCQFPDGRVAIRWAARNHPASTVAWDSIADAIEVHGHDGNTIVTYVDPDPDGTD